MYFSAQGLACNGNTSQQECTHICLCWFFLLGKQKPSAVITERLKAQGILVICTFLYYTNSQPAYPRCILDPIKMHQHTYQKNTAHNESWHVNLSWLSSAHLLTTWAEILTLTIQIARTRTNGLNNSWYVYFTTENHCSFLWLLICDLLICVSLVL